MQGLKKSNTIAYFDFDGTITTKDTLFPFILSVIGYARFIFLLPILAPCVILYICKFIDNEQAKTKVLSIVFKDYSYLELDKKANEFAKQKLSKYIKPNILNIMQNHIQNGDKVCLVSANLAIYLRYWVLQFSEIDVIATEIEFNHEKIFTGKLSTPNCYAVQKTIRIKQYLAIQNMFYKTSYAYGNSEGDYQMLDMCDYGYYVDKCKVDLWIKRV